MYLTKNSVGYVESRPRGTPPDDPRLAAFQATTPFDLMKFTLTYSGPLPSSANDNRAKEKWDIRKKFHPQLSELFRTHPVLKGRAITAVAQVPVAGPGIIGAPHGAIHAARVDFSFTSSSSDLTFLFQSPVVQGGANFIPLVRKSLGLACELDVTFLRKEEPGSLVLQSGDLDNRMKTLPDALKVPGPSDMKAGAPDADPFYCLLEEDALNTGLNIKTDRLLDKPNAPVSEVHLVIGVTVRVLHFSMETLGFLAD